MIFLLLSCQQQNSLNLLASSTLGVLTDDWEEVTSSKTAEPVESITQNFERFLEENISGEFSSATLMWLSLPAREEAYQSWYLGIVNGYHLFSIQASGEFDFNLIVFDQDGKLRDRREVLWGNDGGSIDLIDQKLVQIKRFLSEDLSNGMEEVNLKIDLNGQFLDLKGPTYIIPERIYPQSSATLLSIKELETFEKNELEDMRNELLASIGFIFRDETVQSKFESTEWYIAGTNSIELSTLEEYNLLLIEHKLNAF